MVNLITGVLGTLFGGSGIASGATNVVKGAALLAMAPILWKWYEGHQNDVAVSFTYAHVLFVLLIVFIVTWVAHKANPNKE